MKISEISRTLQPPRISRGVRSGYVQQHSYVKMHEKNGKQTPVVVKVVTYVNRSKKYNKKGRVDDAG